MARCPKTAAEAFKRLDKRLSKEEKKAIRDAENMVEFHFSLGLWIRNNWIYTGERENLDSLLADLGEPYFLMGDMASSAILEAYQKHLKDKLMKYKFDVMVAMTYKDKDIEVEVGLSDEEVSKIKQYVEEYTPETSLLLILEEKDKKLFDKFWWDTIYPRVFIMMLENGIDNGYIEKYEEDDFDYENEDDFDDICDMYSDDIELEHSSCCICRIPEEWK